MPLKRKITNKLNAKVQVDKSAGDNGSKLSVLFKHHLPMYIVTGWWKFSKIIRQTCKFASAVGAKVDRELQHELHDCEM